MHVRMVWGVATARDANDLPLGGRALAENPPPSLAACPAEEREVDRREGGVDDGLTVRGALDHVVEGVLHNVSELWAYNAAELSCSLLDEYSFQFLNNFLQRLFYCVLLMTAVY